MFDEYMGVIKALGFNFTPAQWGFCGGALVGINQYSALFSLLGCQYGGDCRTSFAVPDLRGRTPMGNGFGPGLTPRVMGQMPGWWEHSLSHGHMASHTHSHTYTGGSGTDAAIHVSTTGGKQQVPATGDFIAPPGNALGLIQDNLFLEPAEATSTVDIGGVETTAGGFISQNLAIGATPAATQMVDLMQPSIAFNYCICLEGIYPSRS